MAALPPPQILKWETWARIQNPHFNTPLSTAPSPPLWFCGASSGNYTWEGVSSACHYPFLLNWPEAGFSLHSESAESTDFLDRKSHLQGWTGGRDKLGFSAWPPQFATWQCKGKVGTGDRSVFYINRVWGCEPGWDHSGSECRGTSLCADWETWEHQLRRTALPMSRIPLSFSSTSSCILHF